MTNKNVSDIDQIMPDPVEREITDSLVSVALAAQAHPGSIPIPREGRKLMDLISKEVVSAKLDLIEEIRNQFILLRNNRGWPIEEAMAFLKVLDSVEEELRQ